LVYHQPKWMALLILVIAAVLIITGCPPAEQLPADQPPAEQPPVNQSPVIDGLTSQWRQVKQSMPVPIDCAARDLDGDELSYAWSVDGGEITGDGAVGNWVTPEDYGTYTITVTVADGEGAQDTETIDIKVACCLREVDE